MAKNGTEANVFRIPECDIHKYDKGVANVPAVYDAKTKRGPWANLCQECFDTEAMFTHLGTGKGQRLILKDNA